MNPYQPLIDVAKGDFKDMLQEAWGRRSLISLRDYQNEAVSNTLTAFDNDQSALLALATGTGKTEIILGILSAEQKRGKLGRVLYIAHRAELIYQPALRTVGGWDLPCPGIMMGRYKMADKQITIATVQTLFASKQKWLKEILKHGGFSHVVVDECFPAGTLVDGVPIEDIRVGDYVTAYNEKTKTFAKRKVTHKFVNPAPKRIIKISANGLSVTCTKNHPFLTQDGWKVAGEIQKGDFIATTKIPKDRRASVHVLRKRVFAYPLATKRIPKGRSLLLLSRMRKSVFRFGFKRNNGSDEQEICVCSNENQQPHAQAGGQGKGGRDLETNRTRAIGSGREREGDDGATVRTSRSIGCRLGSRVHRQNRNAQVRFGVSVALQGRHCESQINDSDRGGRKLSCPSYTETTGREEDQPLAWSRVDSVEIHEQASDGGLGDMCPGGLVYNLEVEHDHTYIANGFVVHNCHHSSSKTYIKTFQAIRSVSPDVKLFGVTATPFRSDEDELGAIFDVVTYRLGTLKAIEMGALCHFKAKAPILNFSLRDVKRTGEGWNEAKVTELMTTINAEKVIVEKWKEEAEGRPTVVFATSLEQAESLADAFNQKGICAAWASGETPSDERSKILRDYDSGKIQVLINYALFTEGWDAPKTSCVVMARPTSSPIVYQQALGRGMRPHPSKDFCLVLQFVPADAPLDMMLIGDLLGKPKKQQLEEARAAKAGLLLDEDPKKRKERIELGEDEVSSLDFFAKALQEQQKLEQSGLEADPDTVVMGMLNLLNKGPHKKMAWVTERFTKIATLAVAPMLSIAIVPPRPERAERAKRFMGHPNWGVAQQRDYEIVSRYNLYVLDRRDQAERPKGSRPFYRLASDEDLNTVQIRAYEFATKHGEKWLYQKGNPFRKKEATTKQVEYAKRLKVYEEGMDRGRVSQAIDHTVTMNRLRQEGVTGEQRK